MKLLILTGLVLLLPIVNLPSSEAGYIFDWLCKFRYISFCKNKDSRTSTVVTQTTKTEQNPESKWGVLQEELTPVS
uniref:Uncharacterized protein n=1 Tax=Trichobilharzia regenti TaxID=157069 RepID=A0AA85IRX6_TRIRE|nr:unnamed protein product [Trichobilharzia regenti]